MVEVVTTRRTERLLVACCRSLVDTWTRMQGPAKKTQYAEDRWTDDPFLDETMTKDRLILKTRSFCFDSASISSTSHAYA